MSTKKSGRMSERVEKVVIKAIEYSSFKRFLKIICTSHTTPNTLRYSVHSFHGSDSPLFVSQCRIRLAPIALGLSSAFPRKFERRSSNTFVTDFLSTSKPTYECTIRLKTSYPTSSSSSVWPQTSRSLTVQTLLISLLVKRGEQIRTKFFFWSATS